VLLHCVDSRLVRKAPAAYDDGVYMMSGKNRYLCTEAEFLDIIGTKEFSFLIIMSSTNGLNPLPQSDLKTDLFLITTMVHLKNLLMQHLSFSSVILIHRACPISTKIDSQTKNTYWLV